MSSLGQAIYSKRCISIEPLIEHIKSIFRIDPVLVKAYEKVRGIVLLSVMVHQILVYYNYINGNENPKRVIKYVIGL